jgi:hypothetical protein
MAHNEKRASALRRCLQGGGCLQDATASSHGVAGFFNNAHAAVTRRYKNIMTDERTHSIFERFLGLSVSSATAPASGGPGTPKNAGSPEGQARKYEVDAQSLPVCDDDDSDSEEDPLADRRWPAAGPSPTTTPSGTNPFGAASGLSPSPRTGPSAAAAGRAGCAVEAAVSESKSHVGPARGVGAFVVKQKAL